MPEVTRLPPDLSRSVSALARALVAAARSWSRNPGERPAVRASVDRLRTTLAAAISGQALSFGALRSKRAYREGLPRGRVRAIMTDKGSPAFTTTLLRRFITLVAVFPVGTLVRLSTDEVGVVTRELHADPFRAQLKLLRDGAGTRLEAPMLVHMWEPDARGAFTFAVAEAVDRDSVRIDPPRDM